MHERFKFQTTTTIISWSDFSGFQCGCCSNGRLLVYSTASESKKIYI